MLEYCARVYETYLGNEKMHTEYGYNFIPEEQLNEMVVEQITWSNIDNIYSKYGLMLPFAIWKRKKGRQICFFYSYKSIKEWKTNFVNMYVKIHYEKRQASIDTILKHPNSEKAIQYLIERGMSVVR